MPAVASAAVAPRRGTYSARIAGRHGVRFTTGGTMETIALLVTGGRDYSDSARAWAVLDSIHNATPIGVLIHGDARGADTIARKWAEARGVPHDPNRARWHD